MSTRRTFLKSLFVAAATALYNSASGWAQVKRPPQTHKKLRPGLTATIFIDLSEKSILDYAYEREEFDGPLVLSARPPCMKQGKKRRPNLKDSRRLRSASARVALAKKDPTEHDYVVMSAVLTTNVGSLRDAVRRAKSKFFEEYGLAPAPTLGVPRNRFGWRPKSLTDNSVEAEPKYKKLLFQQLSALPANHEGGFVVYEVHLDKARVPAKYRTKCGGINQGTLYLRMMTVLLESCGLPKFGNVYAHPNAKAIRNVSKKALRKHFADKPARGARADASRYIPSNVRSTRASKSRTSSTTSCC